MTQKPKVSVKGDWFAQRYCEGESLEADVAKAEALQKGIDYLNEELEKLPKRERAKPVPDQRPAPDAPLVPSRTPDAHRRAPGRS